MLERLKSLTANSLNVEELVYWAAQARLLRDEFDKLSAAVPEWLDDLIRTLRAEVGVRTADARANRAKQIRAQIEGLKTAQEKRKALEKELAELEPAGATK